MTERPLPAPDQFLALMRRTVQLVGQKVPKGRLREVARAFHALRWEFRDYRRETYFLVSDAGDVDFQTEWTGPVQGTIAMAARTFHDAAFGKTDLGLAFLTGKLKVRGISGLKLGKFIPLLDPFLQSYRQAWEELHGPGP